MTLTVFSKPVTIEVTEKKPTKAFLKTLAGIEPAPEALSEKGRLLATASLPDGRVLAYASAERVKKDLVIDIFEMDRNLSASLAGAEFLTDMARAMRDHSDAGRVLCVSANTKSLNLIKGSDHWSGSCKTPPTSITKELFCNNQTPISVCLNYGSTWGYLRNQEYMCCGLYSLAHDPYSVKAEIFREQSIIASYLIHPAPDKESGAGILWCLTPKKEWSDYDIPPDDVISCMTAFAASLLEDGSYTEINMNGVTAVKAYLPRREWNVPKYSDYASYRKASTDAALRDQPTALRLPYGLDLPRHRWTSVEYNFVYDNPCLTPCIVRLTV